MAENIKINKSIIFFGTPEFAVSSLEALVNAGHDIKAVVTTPDKPAGRGLRHSCSAVKEFAVKKNLTIFQPADLKDDDFINSLKNFNPALFVVVAFRKLPASIWQIPGIGTINLHASLLPKYRGAAPVNHAIINGETITGVTTFFINEDIDKGDILLKEEEVILPTDNAGSLYHKLMTRGAGLLLKTVNGIFSEKLTPFHQDSEISLPLAPKLTKEFCRINWNQPAQKIHDFVRGLSPYPGAWTTLNGAFCKISETNFQKGEIIGETGTGFSDNKSWLKVGCMDGSINILEIQPEGKRAMKINEFLNGFKKTEFLFN